MTEIFDEIVNAVEQAKAQPKEEIQLAKYVVPNTFAKYMKQLGWRRLLFTLSLIK